MPVEFIGMISTRDQSETRRASGPVIDRDYLRRFARAHEDAGFDRVLIGYGSSQPDGIQVAAYAASQTDRLSFLVAHRPGFVAPTLAARTFSTLDQLTGGRTAVHVITGGSDGEQRRDGDFLDKDSRYARTEEYLDVLKQAWTSDGPFDYEGRYYRVKDFYADVRSSQQPQIPLYFGGSSDAAIDRALRLDGWHGSRVTPEQAPAMVKRLRARRPDPDFVISIRVSCSAATVGSMRDALKAYSDAGIQHVLAAPDDREIDAYLTTAEAFRKAGEGL